MTNGLYCAGVLAAAGCLFGQTSGGIQGVISDGSGQFVAGARVIASAVGPGGGRSYMAFSGPAGQYAFAQVPDGNYGICVQGPRHGLPQPGQSVNPVNYLDTCHWSGPTQVSVVAGQIATNINIHLVKGAAVHVRLNDPGQYMARGGGVVLAGVVGSSRFIPLSVVSSDASGRSLELAIPLNTALRLEVNGGRLQLADERGAALPSITTSFPIRQAAGQQDPSLTFTVTGRRP